MNINDFKFEILHNFDRDLIYNLYDRAFDYEGEDAQKLSEWIDIDQLLKYQMEGFGVTIVVKFEDKLVGACSIGQQNPISFVDGKKYEIFVLGVLKEYRRFGLATELLRLSEKLAKDSGALNLILNTHIDLKGVQSFYERNQYIRMGVLKNYYENGDAVFFTKSLIH